jgi:hypothetical protein
MELWFAGHGIHPVYEFAVYEFEGSPVKCAAKITLEQSLKKVLAFFGSGMLQLFESELFLTDPAIPHGGQAL